MSRLKYTAGEKMGECTFIREDGFLVTPNRKQKYGIFICPCGKEFREVITRVRNGKKTSCGCGIVRSERCKRYKSIGVDVKCSEYAIWINMRERCNNPHNPAYPRYGGRGIRVCEAWQESFLMFLTDVGRRPSPKHSLDRHPDVNGNYEPCNVRWATNIEQGRNRRDNVVLEYDGETMCVSAWAEKLGIPQNRINDRLKAGYTVEKALSLEIYGHQKNKKK